MRQKHDLAEHVWYGVVTAINVGEPLGGPVLVGDIAGGAAAGGGRGGLGTGGDASIQHGGFYAAAPWRGIQVTPSPVWARFWVGWRRWPRRKSRRRRPASCHGAVPGELGERKKPGIRPDAPSPSRSGGIRNGNRPRLRKDGPVAGPPQSRTAAPVRGACSAAWGLTPNGARRGKPGLAPEFAFSDSFPTCYPAPAAAKPAEPQASIPRPKTATREARPIPFAGDRL
jgi:hypothetical protein